MKTGQKYLKVRLNYIDSISFLDKLSLILDTSTLDKVERSMFKSMFDAFRIMYNIQCDYFRVCEYTDGKYTLNVRKDLHDSITILFNINHKYNGMRENYESRKASI